MPLAAVSHEALLTTDLPILNFAANLSLPPSTGCAIKLLDLLTNRYHVGKVRSAGRDSLVIEMPASSRLRAHQRIRFALADDASCIVARKVMKPGVIAHVETFATNQVMLVQLSNEPAAA